MFEKLCNNLNQLMTNASINASELGRRIALPASTIKKIRNHDNPNPTLATLLPIARYFSITLSQLVGDHDSNTKEINHSYPSCQFPILSWGDVINWPLTTHKESYSTISVEKKYSKNSYALLFEEEDYIPLSKGTLLFIDPEVKSEHRDFVIVYKKGQKLPSLKQILFDEEQLYLKSLMHGHPISVFTPEHKILGTVMEYRKQLKNNPPSPE